MKTAENTIQQIQGLYRQGIIPTQIVKQLSDSGINVSLWNGMEFN